jgi:hypothetical protein
MANGFLDQLLKGGSTNPIAQQVTPEEEEKIRQYLGMGLPPAPQGMADSLALRSGDSGMPVSPQLPPPLGMAESLRQRSGDDMMPPAAAPVAGGVPGLFRKENIVEESAQLPQAEETPFKDTELEDAMRRRDDLLGLMMMGKGAERVGTAISGTESDKAYLDLLKPFAESRVSDVLTKRQAESNKVDLDTKKFNFAFAKDKDDPNSPTSKFYRDTLKELTQGAGIAMKIPENLSAAEMEKVYPNIINIVNAKEARAARLQQAELTAATKKAAAVEKEADEKKKFTQGLRKELTSGQYGKMFANVNNAQKAAGAIEQFMKDPTGYSDYATLMGGLKALQGDESVVREAEIRLGMQAGSFKEKVTNEIEKLRSGKSLQPGQRQNILKSVQILHDIALTQYRDGIKPILQQAEMEGIDPNVLIPGNVMKDTTRQEAGNMITVREKSTGRMKKLSADKAKQVLANPNYEQVQ